MDETEANGIVTVGERLREAREAKGMSIEEVAATTRIPTRHLASLETSDWDQLPAATYSIGFAKNYATVIGLDRTEIGEQLRAEMGGARPAVFASPEIYETVDPARTMPKGLVFGALGLLVVVVLGLMWLNNRSFEGGEATAEAVNPTAPTEQVAAPAAISQPAASGPVVVTANEAVWLEVRDGSAVLKQGELAAGQSYEVPATAVAPVLKTGKPEALRISVGTADAPTVGPAGTLISGVSLKPADLMRGPTSPASPPGAVTANQAIPSTD